MPRVKLSEKEVLLKLRGASIAYDDISLDAVTKYLNKLVRDKKLESQKNNLVLYGEKFPSNLYMLMGTKDLPDRRRISRESY